MFLKKSLLYRTLAVFLLVAMVPVFVVSILNYYQSKDAIEHKVLEDLDKIADIQAQIVVNWLDERMGNAKFIASGNEVRSNDMGQLYGYLVQVVKQFPTIEAIVIADNQGKSLVGSLPKLAGIDVSGRQYYKTAMEGKASFSDVLISKATGNPIVVAAAPVLDTAGKPSRVVIVTVGLKELNNKLKLDEFGQTGEVYIVNKEGSFITESKFKPGAVLKEKIDTFAFREAISGKHGVGTYQGYQNYNVLGAYKQVPGFDWALIVEQDAKEAFAEVAGMRNNMLVIALLTAVAAGAAGVVFSNRLVRPVQKLVEGAKRLAGGDLTQDIQVNRSDEIGILGQTFNEMTASMRQMIAQVIAGAQQVAATSEALTSSANGATEASKEVAESMEWLARSSGEQGSKMKEMSTIVGELLQAVEQIASGSEEQSRNIVRTSEESSMVAERVREVAERTKDMEQMAQNNLNTAREGGAAVNKTIEGMEQVKEAVFTTANRIRELGGHSQQIGEIIQVIDDIAEQTNLLALNAAIEAARAGEHGKGFAVVADEVRKLAERSSRSTKEIANLIANIQRGTENAISSMEIGTAQVEKGVDLANGAGVSLRNIIDNVTENGKQIAAITEAINSILESSMQVNQAVDNIAAIAEETTASTEQMAAGGRMVSQAVDAVTEGVGASSLAAQEVSTSTEEIFASAEGVAEMARELTKMALDLQEQVHRFRI